MTWVQRLWWITVPACVALMIWGGYAYRDKVIKGGFFRMPSDEVLIFYMRMPEGTDVKVTSETMLRFEQSLMPLHEEASMNAIVFGNQAYMEIEFSDRLLRTGIPALYRGTLT